VDHRPFRWDLVVVAVAIAACVVFVVTVDRPPRPQTMPARSAVEACARWFGQRMPAATHAVAESGSNGTRVVALEATVDGRVLGRYRCEVREDRPGEWALVSLTRD
jgi:hypothetical protein